MSLPQIDRIRERLERVKAAPVKIAAAAAPLIQEKLRADATTKRGNVPAYGRMGNVPIVAEARPQAILVTGPSFVIRKAEEKGQIDEWVSIVRRESQRIFGGGQ